MAEWASRSAREAKAVVRGAHTCHTQTPRTHCYCRSCSSNCCHRHCMHALTRKTSRKRQASHKQGLGSRKLEFVKPPLCKTLPVYDDHTMTMTMMLRLAVHAFLLMWLLLPKIALLCYYHIWCCFYSLGALLQNWTGHGNHGCHWYCYCYLLP